MGGPAHTATAVYESFITELALDPDSAQIVGRLADGHVPDERGWCVHSAHAHRREHHPCPVLRLAMLVERAAAVRERVSGVPTQGIRRR